jgi:lipopolysaccharide transport system ATP-binding protein
VSPTAISAEALSKRYLIGAAQQRHDSLKDLVASGLGNLFRRKPQPEAIWALHDVSFEVDAGSTLGLVGRNGAGKSTLLKILSRITEPTSGRAEVQGRVASLLEVGTGFDRELTGRENIYLSSAILGMKKAETDRKFDQIVDFSGVERFVDTPVKRYSSGMYLRLAFAVAAHLESEVLLVDEVLAVGDANFQKKCLGTMREVAQAGRTVLFVSHNLQAVQLLCPTAILVADGRIAASGESSQVCEAYLSTGAVQAPEVRWEFESAPGTDIAKLRSVRVLGSDGSASFVQRMNQTITLETEFWILQRERVEVSLHIYNQQGFLLFATGNFHDPEWMGREQEPGLYRCSCAIPSHTLNESLHSVKIYLHHGSDHQVDAEISDVVSFEVHDPGDTRGDWTGTWIGMVRPILSWNGERLGDLP